MSLCVVSKCVRNEDLPDTEGSDVDCDYSYTHLFREVAALEEQQCSSSSRSGACEQPGLEDDVALNEQFGIPECSSGWIAGRLKERIKVWRETGASAWVLSILEEGYKLPFIKLPTPLVMRNHSSVHRHSSFFDKAIHDLLAARGCQ